MGSGPDILVTLSTFGAYSDEPVRLLDKSGLSWRANPCGRRMQPEEVVESAADSLGLVAGVEPYTAETLDRLPRLRCISRCGVGTEGIDLEAARARGVAVLNTPDAPTVAVAEYALALILALLRRLVEVDSRTKDRSWRRVEGRLLAGKTVGVIGLGRVGRRVAELLLAFHARVLTADPRADAAWAGSRGVEVVELGELLETADIVTIHASYLDRQPLRLGREELGRMKPGGWLVNLARGQMVDEEALLEALDSGRLQGAALDVYSEEPYRGPLCDRERVILSPHQATLTLESRAAMETAAVMNLLAHLKGDRE